MAETVLTPVDLAPPDSPEGVHHAGEAMRGPADLLGRLESVAGAEISWSSESARYPVCDGKAEVVTGMCIGDMLHISTKGIIEEFNPEKAGENGGKFGKGTYFAIGPLEGESFTDLRKRMEAGIAHGHGTQMTGNFLVLDRDNVKEVKARLATATGSVEPSSRVINRTRNANVADLLPSTHINGESIDGVIVLMGQEHEAAEVIVVPTSTSKLRISSVRSGAETREIETKNELQPRISRNELEAVRSRTDLSPSLQTQVEALINSSSPLDVETSLEVEGTTGMARIPHDLHRQILVQRFGEVMNARTGVDEEYTLGEHTQMVLSIFEQQFAGELSDYDVELTRILRTTLLLQDIGKPLSLELHGSTRRQSDYNHDLAEVYLEHFDFSPEVKTLIAELAGQDILGTYFKTPSFSMERRGKGIDQATTSVTALSERTGFPPRDLLNIMKVLYISDAAAYTGWSEYINQRGEHHRGKPSLEHLFERDASGRISLNPDLERAFDKLYT